MSAECLQPKACLEKMTNFMKTIESVDVTRGANQCNSRLQSESQPLPNEDLDGPHGAKQRRGLRRMLQASRRRANDSRAHSDLARVRHRNWISSVNSDSGAWLSTGLSPEFFAMSSNEFVSAVCRRDAVEDPTVPKCTPILSREDSSVFQCGRDDGKKIRKRREKRKAEKS